ncbi:hypothetical protein Zmor_009089 [Zophobas morio]|uniref:Uncharacterized protein n=1 Tax=Zophobas morio TaxID=2755281 RepID=A0AA38ILE4_9CUCU|nr:hypothetical protein Zmor_009089 [Zophobas morio]
MRAQSIKQSPSYPAPSLVKPPSTVGTCSASEPLSPDSKKLKKTNPKTHLTLRVHDAKERRKSYLGRTQAVTKALFLRLAGWSACEGQGEETRRRVAFYGLLCKRG